MNINLEKITDLLTFLLEKNNYYYEEYKNLINEIEYSFSYWDDSKAQWLNKSLNEIKIKYESLFEELDSVSDIYRTLENKYSVLGNKISFNKENSEDLINLMSEISDNTSILLSEYSYLNLNSYIEVRNRLEKQKEKIKKTTNDMTKMFLDAKDTIRKINDNETEIKNKISNTSISPIEELTTSDITTQQVDNIAFEPDEMQLTLEKVNLSKNSLEVIVDEINDKLKETEEFYKTSNKKELETLLDNLNNKMMKLRNINNFITNLIQESIENYTEAILKIKEMSKDLSEG